MALSKIDSPAIATLSDNIAFADGKGIDFSATSDGSGTMSSELLDFYEEGTWTPTLNTGTCSTGYSTYTRVGNIVRLQSQLYNFSDRTTSSAVIVNGLPFTSSSLNRSSQGVMARFVNSGGDAVASYVFQSSSQLVFYACNQGATYTQVQHAQLNSGSSTLFISITYRV